MGTWYVDLGEHTYTLGMNEYGDMVCRFVRTNLFTGYERIWGHGMTIRCEDTYTLGMNDMGTCYVG